jgi:hypothetical protein
MAPSFSSSFVRIEVSAQLLFPCCPCYSALRLEVTFAESKVSANEVAIQTPVSSVEPKTRR